jgi:hypothetical protein
MKLLEQQGSPIAGLLMAGHKSIGPSAKQRGSELSFTKQSFQAAVVTFLIRPTGGATPMQLEIKLIAPNRQAGAPGLQLFEIGAQGSGLLCHSLRLLFP